MMSYQQQVSRLMKHCKAGLLAASLYSIIHPTYVDYLSGAYYGATLLVCS
jgi:hypothetical protein